MYAKIFSYSQIKVSVLTDNGGAGAFCFIQKAAECQIDIQQLYFYVCYILNIAFVIPLKNFGILKTTILIILP